MSHFTLARFSLFCSSAALCLALLNTARAQTPVSPAASDALKAPLNLTLKDASLSDALNKLRSIGKINIMIDGEPLTKSADVNVAGTGRDALDAVCDAFDYKWTLSKNGIVLLTKRFKNSNERPQMRYAEMVQMAKDMRDALSFSPVTDANSSPNTLLAQLLKSLTPEQYTALTASKTHPFYARDLRADQYQIFVQSLWSFNFPNAYNGADLLLRQLESFPTSTLFADPQNIERATATANGQVVEEQATVLVQHLLRDRSGQRMITPISEPFGNRESKKRESKKP